MVFGLLFDAEFDDRPAHLKHKNRLVRSRCASCWKAAAPRSTRRCVAKVGVCQVCYATFPRCDHSINRQDEEGRSLLHWAVDGGHAALVECLLGRGADVGARDSQGDTPLDYAELCEYAELAALLVSWCSCFKAIGGSLVMCLSITHTATGPAGARGAAGKGTAALIDERTKR